MGSFCFGVWGVRALVMMALVLVDDQNAKPTMDDPVAAWAKAGMPSAHHEHLKPMVGEWSVETRFWMGGPEPVISTGEMTRKMLFSGRYLTGHYRGNFGGSMFEGHELFGYDNMKQKYFLGWIDSMSTGLSLEEGTCSTDGKVIRLSGEHRDPSHGGKLKKTRSVITIVSANEHRMEAFETPPGGTERKSMELIFTRKSANSAER